ncbi:MAG: DUF1801 domain-containing protein [Candidatus Thiodiazotropha sp. L084R]
MQQRIIDYINDLQSVAPEQVKIINSVRALFNKANEALDEEIKYGGLVFLKSGKLIGGIFPYKNHISIEFSDGADFSDPQGLLQGNGKRRRHLKINRFQDIEQSNALFFIEQSIAD